MTTDVPTWFPHGCQPEVYGDPFEVTATHPAATLSIVRVVGELDLATCPEFDKRLDEELQGRPGTISDVIIDFTGLELLSASGIRSVLHGDATARAAHIRLQLVITCPRMTHMLALFDLDNRLCIQPDLATACHAAA